jgi:hypothetical protein
MPTLPESRIAALLAPYLGDDPPPPNLLPQLSTYLDLLLRWNQRTNLTAIREPEEIVRRHFGESLFAGRHLTPLLTTTDVSSRPESSPREDAVERPAAPPPTLLDYGSGAGFPGLPIQLLLPELRVTLAESQGKKASFLREAIRTLGLQTEVWAARVETWPPPASSTLSPCARSTAWTRRSPQPGRGSCPAAGWSSSSLAPPRRSLWASPYRTRRPGVSAFSGSELFHVEQSAGRADATSAPKAAQTSFWARFVSSKRRVRASRRPYLRTDFVQVKSCK